MILHKFIVVFTIFAISIFHFAKAKEDEKNNEFKASTSLTWPNSKNNYATPGSSEELLAADSAQDVVASAYRGSERRRNKYRKRRRHRNRHRYYNNENDFYERDDGYGSPKAPAYSAPSSGYSAPSSNYDAPSPSYEAPSYEAPSYDAPSYGASGGGDDGGDGFNDFLNALTAFLPIGLFLAAIPPNLITVNTGRKKRSDDKDETKDFYSPFLEKINEMGLDKFMEKECQKKLFCEMAQYGAENENANNVQKAMHYVSKIAPYFVKDQKSIMDTLEAVNNGKCSTSFKC